MPDDPFKPMDDKNYLEELVGEGKKFATVEDLAKGKWHSDTLIETLKAEKTLLETQAANGMNVQQLMEEIKKLGQGKTVTDDGQTRVTETTNPPLQNIEEVVLATLSKTEAERKIEANKQAVIAKMNEVWGADSSKELKKTADTLGVSIEYLNGVAQQSPNAFFQLTGLNQNRSLPGGTAVPTSTVNIGGPNSKVRDAAYYRELKKSNPALYKDNKVQVQMARDAHALGESFFN